MQVIDMDQTGQNIAPVGKTTCSNRGTRHVRMLGIEDKWKVTASKGCIRGRSPFPDFHSGQVNSHLPPALFSRGTVAARASSSSCSSSSSLLLDPSDVQLDSFDDEQLHKIRRCMKHWQHSTKQLAVQAMRRRMCKMGCRG
jgi:hypothetical protein